MPIDFEEMNKQLFYRASTCASTAISTAPSLPASGLPEGQELQILETVRDKVPAEVFTTPYQNPVGGNPEAVRANLREATRLLKEAGFEVRGPQAGRSRRQAGHASRFLVQDPADERIALFYKPSLERHRRHRESIRIVDDVQYENRLRSFDFDIIIDVWGQSLSPGNEQREFLGLADRPIVPGSQQPSIGIKNPAIDALIDRIIFAKDRAELVAATKALDRVLLWNFYVVPQFTYRLLSATRAGIASAMPSRCRNTALPASRRLWWFDADKAAKIGKRS